MDELRREVEGGREGGRGGDGAFWAGVAAALSVGEGGGGGG